MTQTAAPTERHAGANQNARPFGPRGWMAQLAEGRTHSTVTWVGWAEVRRRRGEPTLVRGRR